MAVCLKTRLNSQQCPVKYRAFYISAQCQCKIVSKLARPTTQTLQYTLLVWSTLSLNKWGIILVKYLSLFCRSLEINVRKIIKSFFFYIHIQPRLHQFGRLRALTSNFREVQTGRVIVSGVLLFRRCGGSYNKG